MSAGVAVVAIAVVVAGGALAAGGTVTVEKSGVVPAYGDEPGKKAIPAKCHGKRRVVGLGIDAPRIENLNVQQLSFQKTKRARARLWSYRNDSQTKFKVIAECAKN